MASWAGGGGITWRTSRTAAAGLGLLLLLVVWTAAGLLWTITPDRTWLETNRGLAYALALALALALGAAAVTTLVVAVVAIVLVVRNDESASLVDVVGISTMYAALFAGSAWLFRRSDRLA